MNTVAIVTGGLGFIASHLLTEIRNEYDQIILVDNLSPAVHKIQNIIPVPFAKLVIGNVQDIPTWKLVNEILPTGEYVLDVFHLAADTSTGNSINQPSAHVSTNVLGTAVLCEYLASKTEKLRRVVLTSTRAVYGEGLWTLSNGHAINPDSRKESDLEEGKWNPKALNEFCVSPLPCSSEKVFPHPINIYGATKLSQEYILEIWCKAYNIQLQIYRLQNVYGPGQSLWNSYSGVISLFVKKALLGERIEVYEGGGIIRDLIFVKDVAKVLANDEEFPAGVNVIDVGSGIPITLLEVAKIISKYCRAADPEISKKYRIGDVRGIYADNSELTNLFNDLKITELSIGIAELVDWAEIEIVKEGK
jgi:dTDP-L-rhamnose 4-epimerase